MEVAGYLEVSERVIVQRRLTIELVDVLMKVLFGRLFG